MLGGNCQVVAIRVAPGSSEVIAHRNGKNWEVQNALLITLHADICLLRRLISSSTEYSLCPEGGTRLNILMFQMIKTYLSNFSLLQLPK